MVMEALEKSVDDMLERSEGHSATEDAEIETLRR